MKKRMVVISDLHAGHEYGLTPPDYQRPGTGRTTRTGKFERALWQFYAEGIDALKPIDILAVNGDAIEGKGESSGGVELLTADRHLQAQMAADAINYAEAKAVRLIYGTKRHVGKDEDFEAVIVDKLKSSDVKIKGHAFIRVNSAIVSLKHKVGSSLIPHGRMTAIARARLWNVVWNSEHERQPKADILIRSHVHYYGYCGAASWLGITTPALTYNSHYGVRECEGLVDVGFLVFDFNDEGWSWRPVLAKFNELKVQPESL